MSPLYLILSTLPSYGYASFSSKTAPSQRARYADETGNVFFLYPEYAEYRSQDLVHCFNDAAICFANKADMYLGHTPWGPRNLAYEIHPMYAQDIDNEEDWEMMEFKYQYLKSKGKV